MRELVTISGKGGTGGDLGLAPEADVSTGGGWSSSSTKPVVAGARTATTTLAASFSREDHLWAVIGPGEKKYPRGRGPKEQQR
jgi:hypothetical protein